MTSFTNIQSSDQPELRLSEAQLRVFDGWKRAEEALPPPNWFPGGRQNLGPSMSFTRKMDLVQDAATDCSVVASLCAGTARAARGHSKVWDISLLRHDQSC